VIELDARERESVLRDLASGDDEVRRLAVERTALLASAEALPLLAERLGDASWRVRKAAVEAIAGAPEDWPAAGALIAALADGENPGRRNAAVEALVRVGRRMVEPLLAATASPDVDVRKLVVDALAGIGSERGVPRLVEMLADPDPNVRSAAADALAAIGGGEAGRALAGCALREDEERLVRFSALRGLARLEAPLRAAQLASALSDPVLRPVAFGALGYVDDPEAEEELLKGLGSGSRATREAAIEALLRIAARAEPGAAERLLGRVRDAALGAPHALEDAIRRLAEAELGLRLVLVQFLGVVRSPECVVPLLLAARDEALVEVALPTLVSFGDEAERRLEAVWSGLDADVRALACDLLGRTRGALGAARLAAAVADADPGVRIAAAAGLARRGDPAALPALVRRLTATAGDPEPEAEDERHAATDAVVHIAGGVSGPDARRAVLELLTDGFDGAPEPVRLALARVLHHSGGPEDASVMALLVQDPSAVVRRAAVSALPRVGAEAEWLRLALADEDAGVRIAAAAALAQSARPEARVDLEQLLADEDAAVRAAAARAIAGLGCWADPGCPLEVRREVARLLEVALADVGPVAMAAVEAFEHLGGALCLEPVRRVLAHPDAEVVQSAIRCLARQGAEEDLQALLPLLGHGHWAVRADVIGALAERRLRSALPAVLRRLEVEQDEFVRDVLLQALARLEEG
jgi:HEAT repeat protein